MKSKFTKTNLQKMFLVVIIVIATLLIYEAKVKANADFDNPFGQNNTNFLDEAYWEWHTRTTNNDMAYNGRHIKITDAIDFYGYGITSYKDFLYKDYEFAGKKIFTFQIDETKGNYHTLDGAGFIFNAKNDNGKLTGDVLLINQDMIYVYRLENIDINTFETTANRDVKSYANSVLAAVKKPNATIHNLVITTSPVGVSVVDNGIEILNLKLDASTHAGEDFGLLVSYLQHSCSILTNIKFIQFDLKLEDYKIPVFAHEKESNKSVESVLLEIIDEKGQVVRKGETDKDGLWNIRGLVNGIYTLNIRDVPAGYILNKESITFKITTEGKAVDIKTGEEISLEVLLEKKKYEFSVSAINEQKQGIQGATLQIIKKDGTEIGKSQTDANGNIKFIGHAGENYIIKNIAVPEGYILNEDQLEFKITTEGKAIDIKTGEEISLEMLIKKSVVSSQENNKKEETIKTTGVLPNAGVGSPNLLIFGVLIIILGTGVVQYIYTRKK